MGLFVKTFLVGLTLVMTTFRHYFNRWENQLKAHMSDDVYQLLKEVINNVTLILEAIAPLPPVLFTEGVRRSDTRYVTALSNLRQRSMQFRAFQVEHPMSEFVEGV